RGPSTGRDFRASAVERVLPEGRLHNVGRPSRAEQQLPSQLSGAGAEQHLDLWHGPGQYGGRNPQWYVASIPDKGSIRRTHPDPDLPERARRQGAEQRIRSQRDSGSLPQCPQWRRERWRRQRPPLPRDVLRLPLEYDAGPARQDQYASDGSSRIWT